MRRLCSISKSHTAAMMLAGILLFACGRGWTQPAQNIAAVDPFAAIDHSLSSAADRVLAQHAVESSNDKPLPAVTTEAVTRKVGIRLHAVNRVQQLRPILEPILREEKVPAEVSAIVLIESGGQPNALSAKGARGIWQFMPDTARRYGLVVSPNRDERLDIEKSTRAAARYLRDLYGQFGDWQLTFAAYNAGEDLVQQAINRDGTRDFSKLSSGRFIPLETRRYVPAVINAMQKVGSTTSFVTPSGGARDIWVLYAMTQTSTGENRTEILEKTKGELK